MGDFLKDRKNIPFVLFGLSILIFAVWALVSAEDTKSFVSDLFIHLFGTVFSVAGSFILGKFQRESEGDRALELCAKRLFHDLDSLSKGIYETAKVFVLIERKLIDDSQEATLIDEETANRFLHYYRGVGRHLSGSAGEWDKSVEVILKSWNDFVPEHVGELWQERSNQRQDSGDLK